jgi:hypothetical protein
LARRTCTCSVARRGPTQIVRKQGLWPVPSYGFLIQEFINIAEDTSVPPERHRRVGVPEHRPLEVSISGANLVSSILALSEQRRLLARRPSAR